MTDSVEHQLEEAKRHQADALDALRFARNRMEHAEQQVAQNNERVAYWESVLEKVGPTAVVPEPVLVE